MKEYNIVQYQNSFWGCAHITRKKTPFQGDSVICPTRIILKNKKILLTIIRIAAFTHLHKRTYQRIRSELVGHHHPFPVGVKFIVRLF